MVKYSYHREQYDLLAQFVAAFDDTFVFRYNKDHIPKEKIKVRYIMGPKQRVIYDIVDQAKNITLPAVAMEQKNIKRDPNRVQFKDQHIYRSHLNSNNVSKIPMPIPVTLDIDVSIIAGYKEDIDQIANNIISWINPYFVISWKIPEEFGLDFIDELRTEVSWDGEVSYENPTNIAAQDKYRIIGNCSFHIKGWIFPSIEQHVAPIYVVNSNFHAVGTGADIYSYNYPLLSANEYPTDYITISAYPEITNTFFENIPIYDDFAVNPHQDNIFTFYGKRFGFNNSWYLSGNFRSNLVFEEIDTFRYPTISAYRLPEEVITTYNDNIVSISLSSNYLSSGSFTFVSANSAGWIRDPYVVVVN